MQTEYVTTLTPATLPSGVAPWVRLVRERPPHFTALSRAEARGPRESYLAVKHLQDEEVEVFVALCLDAQHRIIARHEVTRGILNCSLVHPREVFRVAIAVGAASIVLAHNHPSGDTTPSGDDRAITRQLREAGWLLDIPVHDHIIVGHESFLSFAERGMMQ
ncbi:MAG: DNA repair protein RadC [Burkholderiales bacterium]|nr:DNA repair protein RadC [Burkholderiales bacterium]